MNMDIDTLHSIVTLISFLTFLGIVAWAYSGKRKAAFEQAALTPFDEEDGSARGGHR